MSGPICPDCGSTWLGACPEPDAKWKQSSQCETCGWRGDISGFGRKSLMPEGYELSSHEHEMKKLGKLFFVRVFVTSRAEKSKDDALFGSMEILDVHGMSNLHRDGMLVGFCRIDHRPTDEQISQIKKLKGVQNVTVF